MQQRKIDTDLLLQLQKEGKQQKDMASHFGVSPAAISKALKRLGPNIDDYDLTDTQKKFVLAKLNGKTNTQAALDSYEVASFESAKSLGYKLYNTPKIKQAYDELMERNGMGQSYRVIKLKSHVDNKDPNVSLKALDMTFKLEGAYTEKFVVGHVTVRSTVDRINEELRRLDSETEIQDVDTIIEGELGEEH
jgi:predicted transcriptional regulator